MRLRGFIELVRAELRKRRQVAILRHVQAKRASYLAHRFDLRVAAYTADGNSHVNCRADARVKKIRFQINLPVGNGNDVGRNVSGNVSSLRFNYRQRSQRPRTKFIVELRGPFQQTGMKIKHVAWESFAARRSSQQQRNFAISLRVLRKIVVKSNRVPLGVAEKFPHGASRIRCNVLQRSRLRRSGGHHDGVIHGARVRKRLHHLRDCRALLPDAAVNTNYVTAFLIDDGVQNHRGLAGLPIADNQFALASADRNHRVDSFDTGLQRLTHWLPVQNAWRYALQRVALF